MDADLEELMGTLGDFGPYSKLQFFLHLLPCMTSTMDMFTLITVAAVPAHRCLIPGENASYTLSWDSPDVREWIPSDGEGLDSCRLFNANRSATVECNAWTYDQTYYISTLVNEWTMVCDRRWMRAVAQSAHWLGVFAGDVVMGTLADRMGRKKILYVSCVLQMVVGLLLAFTHEFYSYLFLRFLFGIFGAAYNTAFVLTMELIGPGKRTACGATYGCAFAFGIMLVAFWGWLIPDAYYLQIIYALHSALLLGHWWLVDESPRWLWSQGRREEAVEIVKKALRFNGDENLLDPRFDEIRSKPMLRRDKMEHEAGVLSLVRTPNLRKRTINLCLNWFANSLAYYGLVINTGNLPGNPHLTFFVSGLLEMPFVIFTGFIMNKVGRRGPICCYMIIGGVTCLISAFLSTEDSATTAVVLFGKCLIAGAFAIIYNYTAELYPTVVRNSAVGVGTMSARIAGTVVPLLILLDSFDKTLPTIIFGSVSVISGFLSLTLPDTMNKPMAQTIEEGEKFGDGDTACANCFPSKRKKRNDINLATRKTQQLTIEY